MRDRLKVIDGKSDNGKTGNKPETKLSTHRDRPPYVIITDAFSKDMMDQLNAAHKIGYRVHTFKIDDHGYTALMERI